LHFTTGYPLTLNHKVARPSSETFNFAVAGIEPLSHIGLLDRQVSQYQRQQAGNDLHYFLPGDEFAA